MACYIYTREVTMKYIFNQSYYQYAIDGVGNVHSFHGYNPNNREGLTYRGSIVYRDGVHSFVPHDPSGNHEIHFKDYIKRLNGVKK